jgi:hypothetical protein
MVNFILRLLPLAQLLLVFRLYFTEHTTEALPPFIVGVVVWSIFLIVPFRQLFGCTRNKDTEEGGTQNHRCETYALLGNCLGLLPESASFGSSVCGLLLERAPLRAASRSCSRESSSSQRLHGMAAKARWPPTCQISTLARARSISTQRATSRSSRSTAPRAGTPMQRATSGTLTPSSRL